MQRLTVPNRSRSTWRSIIGDPCSTRMSVCTVLYGILSVWFIVNTSACTPGFSARLLEHETRVIPPSLTCLSRRLTRHHDPRLFSMSLKNNSHSASESPTPSPPLHHRNSGCRADSRSFPLRDVSVKGYAAPPPSAQQWTERAETVRMESETSPNVPHFRRSLEALGELLEDKALAAWGARGEGGRLEADARYTWERRLCDGRARWEGDARQVCLVVGKGGGSTGCMVV